jgi:hypothetical protein
LTETLATSENESQEEVIRELVDLALLGQNLLHGAELSSFIKRQRSKLELSKN